MSTMDPMRAKPGDKIRFANPDSGHSGDRERAAKAGLVAGGVYTLSKVRVYGWHTDVWLDGFGDPFNSVQFESEEGGAPDAAKDAQGV